MPSANHRAITIIDERIPYSELKISFDVPMD